MRHKLLHKADGQRAYAVVLDTGDEVIKYLRRFIADQKISAAQLTAIWRIQRRGPAVCC